MHLYTLMFDHILHLNSLFFATFHHFSRFPLCLVCPGSKPWMHELRAAMFQDLVRTSSSRGLSRRLDRVDITVLQWIDSTCREIGPGRFLCSDPSDLCCFELVGRPSTREQQINDTPQRDIGIGHTRMESLTCFYTTILNTFSLQKETWDHKRGTTRSFNNITYRMWIVRTSIVYHSDSKTHSIQITFPDDYEHNKELMSAWDSKVPLDEWHSRWYEVDIVGHILLLDRMWHLFGTGVRDKTIKGR